MKNKIKFDNAAFIEDVWRGQTAFIRRDDEQNAKELITYTIERIKECMKLPPNEPRIYGVIFEFRQQKKKMESD